MTPKVRYTSPPTMSYHVETWCDGPKCSRHPVTWNGDAWECPNCGTTWIDPELDGDPAEDYWGPANLEGLPLYDDDGDEVDV